MLSLTKMSPSSWRYYAEEVASGREDYYALSTERPGAFVGRGAEALGITALAVDPTALERLFGEGTDPRDGKALGRRFSGDDRAVAGFAVTFSPPKSVSVLWALADNDVSSAVLAGHEAAVTVALSFLEDHGAFTRRGHGGLLQVDTDGLVAASFVHRTSRAADPQLHSHLLVANKVRAEDGAWLAVDARELFAHQKAAGMLYKAALRSELTARLGVAWTVVDDNGIAEIVGVPQALADAWSARRKQVIDLGDRLVAERAGELGRSLSSNERSVCFQIAAYRTRVPKVDADTSTAELKARWREEATRFGHEPERWLEAVLGRKGSVTVELDAAHVAEIVARLEDRAATFVRADIVEEASRLVTGIDAAEVHRLIERLADAVLADPEVLSLAAPLPFASPESLCRRDQMSQLERHGATRSSTKATLRREAAVLEAAARGAGAGVAVVPEATLDAVLGPGGSGASEPGPSGLGADQRRAVAELLCDGRRISALVGPAGAGKSRALEAAGRAWSASGRRVVGLAPSAMAAAVLTEEARIASDTLAKFLLGARLHNPLGAGDVVVLDEAGMARSDDLARLVGLVENAKAKLVLVGDPHQLGAVGPGGLFRTLVADHGAAELETLRRFVEPWEAAATLRLRAGDPSVLSTYVANGRIEAGSRAEMCDAAFTAWAQARARGEELVVMAGDNATVDELSRRCRAELVRRGEVEPGGISIQSGIAGIGDEVVTLRNDRRLCAADGEFVRNGARWRVVDRDEDGALLVARGTSEVILPASYVNAHVALAYALTIHKAQGTTTSRAVVLVDEQMNAAQLYVAMTRGREENRALVVTSEDHDEHARPPATSAVARLAEVMARTDGNESAHEVLRANLAATEDRALLVGVRRAVEEQVKRAVGPDLHQRIAELAVRDDREEARRALADATESLEVATTRRELATSRCADLEVARAVTPRRRAALRRERDAAESTRHDAANDEARSVRRYATAEHRLIDAEARGGELDSLRARQARREEYLRAHPAEAAILGGALPEDSDFARRAAARRMQRETVAEQAVSATPKALAGEALFEPSSAGWSARHGGPKLRP